MNTPFCEGCGGTLKERWRRVVDPQTEEVFSIAFCLDCGLGHTLPKPQNLARFYGPTYHGQRHGLTERYCLARRKRFLRAVMPTTRGKLLDVGCGDGSFLQACKQQGFEVSGVEYNPALARARGLSIADSLEEALRHGPFDVITLWHSLEHMSSPATVLRQLASALTPEGILLLAVPNVESLQANFFQAHWFHLDVPRHLFHFGPKALQKALQNAGLQKHLRRWNQEWEYDVMGVVQSALNRVFSRPHILFHVLTGKPVHASGFQRAFSFLLAGLLLPVAVLHTALSTLIGRGGTLIWAVKR